MKLPHILQSATLRTGTVVSSLGSVVLSSASVVSSLGSVVTSLGSVVTSSGSVVTSSGSVVTSSGLVVTSSGTVVVLTTGAVVIGSHKLRPSQTDWGSKNFGYMATAIFGHSAVTSDVHVELPASPTNGHRIVLIMSICRF